MRFRGIGAFLGNEVVDGLMVAKHPDLIPWTISEEHTVQLALFAANGHLGASLAYDTETALAVCLKMGWKLPILGSTHASASIRPRALVSDSVLER
jgi:hypothetical protein